MRLVVSWPVVGAALLIGVSITLMTAGLAVRLHHSLAPEPPAAATIVAAVLFALAVGVRAPQRWTYRYAVAAWRRFAQDARPPLNLSPLMDPSPVDRPLCWTVLAIMALAGGVAAALTPTIVSVLAPLNWWLHGHFVWSTAPLAVLHLLFALIACLVPCAAMGLSVAVLHALWCPRKQWDIRAAAYVLFGAAAACVILAPAESADFRADPILLAASLPLLIVALITSATGSSESFRPPAETSTPEPAPPVSSDCWPALLRASIVAVGGGSVCAMIVWSRQQLAVGANGFLLTAASLAALAIGVMIEHAARRNTVRSIGGFGVACAVAGIAIAFGALTLLRESPLSTPPAMFLAAPAVAATGYCVSYGREVLMARVAHRSAVSALMLARLLICAGATVWLTAPLAIRLFGEPAALLMFAISLLALGGILIIHEPNYAAVPRRIRLGAVFASIALLMLLARPRSGHRPAQPTPASETPPVIAASHREPPPTSQAVALHDR